MNTEKLVKEATVIMIATLVLGLLLLAGGIALELLDVGLLPNDKAVVGLSFIPLGVSLAYFNRIRRIRKMPQVMRPLVISETDERLVAQKNEIDARAFRILQGALFLAYMGYTLSVPEDIFEAVGWWILLGLLALSVVAQVAVSIHIKRRDERSNDGPD